MLLSIHSSNTRRKNSRYGGFLPKDVSMPATSSTERAIKAPEELAASLSNPSPTTTFHTFGDETLEALQQLSNVFFNHSKGTTQTTTEGDVTTRHTT